MRRALRPASRSGRAACWLALAFVLWLFLVDVPLAKLRDDSIPEPLFLTQLLLGFATGLAAATFALVSLLRARERSILVYASLLPGVFVVVALAWETFAPH